MAAIRTITASSDEGLSRSGEQVTGTDERTTSNGFALQKRTNLIVFSWIIKFLGGKATEWQLIVARWLVNRTEGAG